MVAVGLIDDNDKTDEILYKVSWWWSDNSNNEEFNNTHWNAMFGHAHECAEAIRRSSPFTDIETQVDDKEDKDDGK